MYIYLLSTDKHTHTTHRRSHTHTNILRESGLSLGAAKSCQETLYPSLSPGLGEHFTYDIWRKKVRQEGGVMSVSISEMLLCACVRVSPLVCRVWPDVLKERSAARLGFAPRVNWKSTAFGEREAKHASASRWCRASCLSGGGGALTGQAARTLTFRPKQPAAIVLLVWGV